MIRVGVIMNKKRTEEDFKFGNCFKCGKDISEAHKGGYTDRDSYAAYIYCPYCKAVNAYRKRLLEWLAGGK